MDVSRRDLRMLGRVALERRGYVVTARTTAGARPGARLGATKEGDEFEVAIRTSLSREAGFTRIESGKWTTISRMNLVLVVVPSSVSTGTADVYCFKAKKLIDYLEKSIATRSERMVASAPVFAALDEQRPKKSKAMVTGLAKIADWQVALPIIAAAKPTEAIWDLLVDRFVRDAADLLGTKPDNISVEVRIVSNRK